MHKLILFNGIMTVAGLITDMVGVAWMNSGTVAISGAILGTVDTISYIYIMRHRKLSEHQKQPKFSFKLSLPNLPFLRSFSQKKRKKGVNR